MPTGTQTSTLWFFMMMLNLHEHKEAIEEIVETAMKELKIEKKLKEIELVWSSMEIDYAPHKDTEMFIPKPSEEVVESIESHQMELQGIFGMGKFMDYFKDRVIHWQSRDSHANRRAVSHLYFGTGTRKKNGRGDE